MNHFWKSLNLFKRLGPREGGRTFLRNALASLVPSSAGRACATDAIDARSLPALSKVTPSVKLSIFRWDGTRKPFFSSNYICLPCLFELNCFLRICHCESWWFVEALRRLWFETTMEQVTEDWCEERQAIWLSGLALDKLRTFASIVYQCWFSNAQRVWKNKLWFES